MIANTNHILNGGGDSCQTFKSHITRSSHLKFRRISLIPSEVRILRKFSIMKLLRFFCRLKSIYYCLEIPSWLDQTFGSSPNLLPEQTSILFISLFWRIFKFLQVAKRETDIWFSIRENNPWHSWWWRKLFVWCPRAKEKGRWDFLTFFFLAITVGFDLLCKSCKGGPLSGQTMTGVLQIANLRNDSCILVEISKIITGQFVVAGCCVGDIVADSCSVAILWNGKGEKDSKDLRDLSEWVWESQEP